MTTVAYIVSRVSEILQDVAHDHWSEQFLVDSLNEILQEAVLYKPNIFVKTEVVTPVAGTRQTLPAGGLSLGKVICNMGATGTNAGKAVRLVDQDQLDLIDPYWHGASSKAETVHAAVDASDQGVYYISPPTSSQLKIMYFAKPTTVVMGGSIPIDDVYTPALIKGVLYMAYSSDGEHANNAQLAAAYYQAFVALLVGKAQAESIADANSAAPSNSKPE